MKPPRRVRLVAARLARQALVRTRRPTAWQKTIF
jgi:hypothetical protein